VATKVTPLSSLTSSTAKWDWTEQCQKAFEDVKKLIEKETLLTYPNFNNTFEIHTDASKVQLGACISQEGQPVAFYHFINCSFRTYESGSHRGV
jgi:RNase H-like domain found in reverse transcriptase